MWTRWWNTCVQRKHRSASQSPQSPCWHLSVRCTVVSIFRNSTGATIIINSRGQSPIFLMFLMVIARCHQVFTSVSFLPENFFCSTENSTINWKLTSAHHQIWSVTQPRKCECLHFFIYFLFDSIFYNKKALQPMPMFVWSAFQHFLNFNFTTKVCTRWMRALWEVLWRFYNCDLYNPTQLWQLCNCAIVQLYNCDLCNPTQKPGLWSSF